MTMTRLPSQRPARPDEADHEAAWKLVAAAGAGDQAAIGDLYRMYHRDILRYLQFRIRGNPDLAEDLASEVWVRAIRRLGAVQRTAAPPLAYLFTIARNLLADHWKSGKYRLETVIGDVRDLTGDTAGAEDVAAQVEDYLTSRELCQAMATLPDRHREVLVLRFFQQLSVEETAAVLGLAVGATKALQFRATNNLRRQLGDIRALTTSEGS